MACGPSDCEACVQGLVASLCADDMVDPFRDGELPGSPTPSLRLRVCLSLSLFVRFCIFFWFWGFLPTAGAWHPPDGGDGRTSPDPPTRRLHCAHRGRGPLRCPRRGRGPCWWRRKEPSSPWQACIAGEIRPFTAWESGRAGLCGRCPSPGWVAGGWCCVDTCVPCAWSSALHAA